MSEFRRITPKELETIAAGQGGYDPDAPALPCVNCGAMDVTILGYSEWDIVVYKCNCCGQEFLYPQERRNRTLD